MIRSATVRCLAPVLALAAATVAAGREVRAQALNYPALQVPSVSNRDYTAAVVGNAGTMMMFQWREEVSAKLHVGFDLGLYDPVRRGERTAIFGAVNLGRDLLRATSEQPLDILLTGGAGVSIASGRNGVRLPVGVSVGHTFELEYGMAVTPFVHPRASIDLCASCSAGGRSQREVSLNFDVGASFDFNQRLSARVAALFSGADRFGAGDAISVGLTWTPDGLRR
jgi:hypothetical protein